MGINKPYHRNYRNIKKGPNSGYSDWAYIVDHEYAKNPEHYTRAFLLIQDDLRHLFEFVEPADENLKTYSFRIHELFMRTCIEIEANFKAILKENIYTPTYKRGKNVGKLRTEDKWTIDDYRIMNKTHHLDDYRVEIPIWQGKKKAFSPFSSWKKNQPLKWYQAYNSSKHDRQNNFKLANLENLLNAVTGLFILLSSQFRTESFSPGNSTLGLNSASYYSGSFGLGGFFIIEFPTNWEDDEKYDFDWNVIGIGKDRFEKIDFNKI